MIPGTPFKVYAEFTQIPNGILDKLLSKPILSNYGQLIWFLIRHTFGYQKHSNEFDEKYIVNKTGLPSEDIGFMFGKLDEAGVTTTHIWDNIYNNRIYKVYMNTNYNNWDIDSIAV